MWKHPLPSRFTLGTLQTSPHRQEDPVDKERVSDRAREQAERFFQWLGLVEEPKAPPHNPAP